MKKRNEKRVKIRLVEIRTRRENSCEKMLVVIRKPVRKSEAKKFPGFLIRLLPITTKKKELNKNLNAIANT
jgi:hypothetical protein